MYTKYITFIQTSKHYNMSEFNTQYEQKQFFSEEMIRNLEDRGYARYGSYNHSIDTEESRTFDTAIEKLRGEGKEFLTVPRSTHLVEIWVK